jgi:hypothetical protein
LELPAFQYHDLGDQMTARFGQLPNASEGDGFTLSFTGGEDDRASVIHYWWYVVVRVQPLLPPITSMDWRKARHTCEVTMNGRCLMG